jgi:hypothetical protein
VLATSSARRGWRRRGPRPRRGRSSGLLRWCSRGPVLPSRLGEAFDTWRVP